MGSRLLQSGIPVEREAAGNVQEHDLLETPFTQEMFMAGFNFDPFVNELARIRHLMKCLELKHETKKLKIRPQYEQEVVNVRIKYDLLLKIEDATYMKEKALLQESRQKIQRSVSVGKEFRAHFGEQRGRDASHDGLVLERISNSILGPAPTINQIEKLRTGSILGHAPPRVVVGRLERSSSLHFNRRQHDRDWKIDTPTRAGAALSSLSFISIQTYNSNLSQIPSAISLVFFSLDLYLLFRLSQTYNSKSSHIRTRISFSAVLLQPFLRAITRHASDMI